MWNDTSWKVRSLKSTVFGTASWPAGNEGVFKMTGMSLEETEAMLDEAILLSRLGHPNIVRVFDADTTETPEVCTASLRYST